MNLNKIVKFVILGTLLLLQGCKVNTADKSSQSIEQVSQLSFLEEPILIDSGKTYYQAFDSKYPDISPVFHKQEDAELYAEINNFDKYGEPTGHEYEVREINHRFEVRLTHNFSNNILYKSNLLYNAEDYLDHYEKSYGDVYIYDVIEQDFVEVKSSKH